MGDTASKLRQYYQTPSYMELMGQSRHETTHTRILAWLFNNLEFNTDFINSPVYKLLYLIQKWDENQQNNLLPSELNKALLMQETKLNSLEVTPEYGIEDEKYGKGSIDIFIRCNVSINNVDHWINIVIENKVAANETEKNGKGGQTSAYYNSITKKYKDDWNLFVYLKPITTFKLMGIEKPECECEKYIEINYQELLDNVIEPTYNRSDISNQSKIYLSDYIKSLGKPAMDNTNKITVMAISAEERELLINFFNKNEDLIRAAYQAKASENIEDYDLQNEYNEVVESMQKVTKQRKKYSYNGEGPFSMTVIAMKYAQSLIGKEKSADDIQKHFKDEIGLTGRGIYFGKAEDISETDSSDIRRYVHFEYKNDKYAITNQWASTGNFKTLIEYMKTQNIDVEEVS